MPLTLPILVFVEYHLFVVLIIYYALLLSKPDYEADSPKKFTFLGKIFASGANHWAPVCVYSAEKNVIVRLREMRSLSLKICKFSSRNFEQKLS